MWPNNHNFDQKYLSQSVLNRVLYGQITLGGDAHHEEGLEGHEDVLEGVPHVGEEHDEQLVVQVEIEPLQDSWLVLDHFKIMNLNI